MAPSFRLQPSRPTLQTALASTRTSRQLKFMELLVHLGTKAHPHHGTLRAPARRNGAATSTIGASCHGATSAIRVRQRLPAPYSRGPRCTTVTTLAEVHQIVISIRRIGIHGKTCPLVALSIAWTTAGTRPRNAPSGLTRRHRTIRHHPILHHPILHHPILHHPLLHLRTSVRATIIATTTAKAAAVRTAIATRRQTSLLAQIAGTSTACATATTIKLDAAATTTATHTASIITATMSTHTLMT